MNDREKLAELLSGIIDGGFKWHSYSYESGEQLNNDEIASHLIDNGVTVQRWIPATERLPEKNTAVIAVTDNDIVFQCLYAYDGWDLWEGNEVHITHWMPLPEPPKENDYGKVQI